MPLDRERVINILIGAGNPPDRTPRYAPRKSRRDFLKWGFAAAGATVGVPVFYAFSPRTVQKQHEAAQNTGEDQTQEGAPLQTKVFAREIVDAAYREQSFDEAVDLLGLLASLFAGTMLGQTILRVQPEIFNRILGLGSGVVARSLDEISTFVAATVLSENENKIREYGLDAYFYENNPNLPADLTPKALLDSELISTLELAGITIAYPATGKIYLSVTPFLFKSNLDVAHAAVVSLGLGDQVKAMIQQGKSEQEISNYLKNVGKEQAAKEQSQRQIPQ